MIHDIIAGFKNTSNSQTVRLRPSRQIIEKHQLTELESARSLCVPTCLALAHSPASGS